MLKVKGLFRNSLLLRGFIMWFSSLIVPFLIFFLFLFVQYGDSIVQIFSNDLEIWQINGYTASERISREINLWTLGDPVYGVHPELDEFLENNSYLVKNHKGLLFERKGDQIRSLIPLSDEEVERVTEDFSELERNILPEFGENSIETNRQILELTGYVLLRQIDFYYADGSEGTVYMFIKYSNIPYHVIKVIGDNIMFVIGIMLILNGLIAMIIIKKSTKPINDLKEAMASYKKDDFSVRLEENHNHHIISAINTSVNDMARELESNQKKKEATENVRREFLARISHDTKTPLASIKAHAEAIRDGLVKDEKQTKYASNILSKVESLDNMINELSVYSNLEAGINQYLFTRVNLNSFLGDLIDEMKYDFSDRLTYESCKESHDIYLDVNRFHRVMVNLISNAYKYGKRDGLNVKISLEYTRTHAVIVLLDDGVGVDIKDPNKLLESFVRGDVSRDPNNAGSGLGLSIVKSIVEKHEGSVELFSEYGHYFKVMIQLPLKGGYFETGSNH
ncbi:HAMP domain-containing histidine kinase [Acidaminobacter sp. JC074]|uniref:sensor histidine kinase n=1 Tax=Acidaminobacter sp. JC074 TaxID=2530199 RepID=UPI001F0CF31F|nr:HAMP domain-containing sensor histidine kinase [Acidaminobacter sp. JC074]MCH4887419.1 HAMP domain-containing histidine kinase [Acidaminobacter sp. JC074]